MIKFLIIVVILVGLMVFTVPGQKLTANFLDAISPVAQERQLLTGLQKNIDGISTTINQPEFQKLNDGEKLKQLNTLVQQATNKTQAIQNAINQGDLSATASLVIQKITKTIGGTQDNSQSVKTSVARSDCPNK